MITITNKLLFFKYKRIWFAKELPHIGKFDFVSLRQYSGIKPKNLKERQFSTLHSDLTNTEEQLLQKLSSTTKKHVRRAEREGVTVKTGNLDTFQIFFNKFAPSKNLKKLSKNNLKSYQPYAVITQAEYNNEIISMHMYIIDKEDSRVRALYAATVNRENTSIDLKLIAMANKLLHWKDMLTFKEMGIKTYDWGGIANNPDDPVTTGIDTFKKSFGGFEVQENHYETPSLQKLKKILGK